MKPVVLQRDLSYVLAAMTADVADSTGSVDVGALATLLGRLRNARRVFLVAQGRTGAIARAVATRLAHIRPEVHLVGGATVPPIRRGDLLIACSGSGETPVTCLHARTAKGHGATVAAMTAERSSTLGRLADLTIVIAAGQGRARQLGGSLFEQSLLVLLDAVALALARERGLTDAALRRRHANLE